MRQILNDVMLEYSFKTFTKKERSSFSYWYNHWKAFNLTAIYLGHWKFKYLFHDIEKPWLRLFLPYEKVQKLHRENNSHHFEYKKGIYNIDYEALIIDNECSRFTKSEAQLNAREFIWNMANENRIDIYSTNKCFEILDKWGL